jgi:hypothetical protein
LKKGYEEGKEVQNKKKRGSQEERERLNGAREGRGKISSS